MAGEKEEQLELITADGNVNYTALTENSLAIAYKIKYTLNIWFSNLITR